MKTIAAAALLIGLAASPAAACGWLNERCCAPKTGRPSCEVDGLVCVDGRCREEAAACGGNGETCCPGEACDLHSLVCLSGSCTPCGKLGEPVCNEDGVSPCNSGLEPSDGICAEICGDAGWICCPGDVCKFDDLICSGGTCVDCGGAGESCCGGASCDLHSLACVSGTCTPCGKLGEPVCTESGVSPCNTGLEDSDGICSEPCGGSGEACCPGDDCDLHSLACVSDVCTPCGKLGQPVCTESGVSPCNTGLEDSDGICSEPCGAAGEACCPGDDCDLHSLACVSDVCTPCGKLGQPVCTESGVSPCATGLEDISGICSEPCGGNGEDCCPGDSCDLHSLACVSGTCTPCGKEGEPVCTEDGVASCNAGLEDSAGICTDCGELTEACCADSVCIESTLLCQGGICIPCGALNQQTCAGDTPCVDDLVPLGSICSVPEVESVCGDLNALCCSGDKCNDDDTVCFRGICAACGTANKPACAGDEPCEEGLELTSGGRCVIGKQLKFGSFPKFGKK